MLYKRDLYKGRGKGEMRIVVDTCCEKMIIFVQK